ncbi:hypothetical protein EV198_3326 [Roseivirga ehrenbergii]|uniref:Uncharacterized protein n=1 Tax=Roseivirga ehrenbergii (strain DSM 102268 / JCM 13514 / KCTC 12282 / NCIMB 14502 / KMM 6017) TaxID=279360 RepID=A0A150WY85_ROSEK|nr:hypothetical protein [Roseivirga ehrenbergii]KYG71450.1 hypothetical protein MB14_11800 [Roseivirga ehrenbergii]TCK99498.1 hypothetical protein EV198_3326 [Roseivirga ehrenbergii]
MKKVLSGIFLVIAVITYFVFSSSGYGEKLEFNGTDVYYTDLVTEADAQRLGEYLVDSEFADGNGKSVQLTKRDSTYLFRMVVIDGVTEDSTKDISFKALAMLISMQVFDGAPVELEACSNTFETLRTY